MLGHFALTWTNYEMLQMASIVSLMMFLATHFSNQWRHQQNMTITLCYTGCDVINKYNPGARMTRMILLYC